MGKSVPELIGEARSRQRRLAHWLKQHHAEIASELGTGRVDWGPLLAVVTRLGLVDERGARPTAATLARTWRRVKRRVEEGSREVPLRADEIARGVQLVEPATAAGTAGPPPIAIQPVRPLAAPQALTAPPAPEPTAPLREGLSAGAEPAVAVVTTGQDQGADRLADTLRDALGRAGRGRVPLPATTP